MKEISVQITIGSSPPQVERYVVAWSLLAMSKTYSFDKNGGIIQETILLADDQQMPAELVVDIAVDFAQKSNISGYRFSKRVSNDANLFSYFFEVGQIIREADICFDLPFEWVGLYKNDYLAVEWTYSELNAPLYFGVFLIRMGELTSFVRKSFAFLSDPGGSQVIGDLSYEITGRLHDWPVEFFKSSFSLGDGQFVVLRPEYRNSPARFLLRLVS
jgi:hypothetical protein